MSYSHWQRSYGQQGFDFPLSLLSAANRWSSERPWYSKSSLGTPGTWRNLWGSPESFGSGPVCSCLPPRSSRASVWRLPSLPAELRRRPRGRRDGSVRPGLRGSCWTGLASAASCFLRPSLGDFLNQTMVSYWWDQVNEQPIKPRLNNPASVNFKKDHRKDFARTFVLWRWRLWCLLTKKRWMIIAFETHS